jgi:hypothetical protein
VGPRAGLDVLEKRKILAYGGIRSLDRAARNLVSIPTELSGLSNKYPVTSNF